MFSKKIRLEPKGKSVSVATALVLLAISELIQEDADGKVYGYQIMSHLKDSFNWNVKSGTIYPILKNLDKENLIRRSIIPMDQEKSKRQTIYYKLTNKGKNIVQKIESLNDEALDVALAATFSKKREKKDKVPDFSAFPTSNFTKNFFMKFLLDYDLYISKLITADISHHRIEELENEIHLSIKELKDFENLLNVHLSKLRKIKDLDNN